MTSISIGTIQTNPNLWLALAVEQKGTKLVACTSSNHSAQEAESQLKHVLRRLNLLNSLEETAPSAKLTKIANRLSQLLLGKGHPFTMDEISQMHWSQARRTISKQLLQVPRGKVISYGHLAEISASSPRGVGSVMRSNPVPWAIPCHRVIHSDGRLGKLGGTVAGTKEKERILRAEGVLFNENGTVNHKGILR